MRRMVTLALALVGFAGMPAAAQVHVSVAIRAPHVAGVVVLGRPHVHRRPAVVVVAPHRRAHRPLVVVRHGHRHGRHAHVIRAHRHPHVVGVCGGGYGCP